MKRILIAGAVGIALIAMLLVGFALGAVVSPAQAQIGQALRSALPVQSIQSAVQAQSTQTSQLKPEKGILVGGVLVNSPADKAGLVRGDIILQADGKDVNTRGDLDAILANHKAGDALPLLVQYGDQQKTVTVTLAAPPTEPAVTPAAPQATPQPGSKPGPAFQNNVKSFIGIIPIGINEAQPFNHTPGAAIEQVSSGSPAEKAGLKAGDVITAVDGTAIDAQNNLPALIAKHKPGDSVSLSITSSDGTQRTVNVTLGDNPQKQGTAYLGVSVEAFGVPGGPGNPNGGPFFRRGFGPNLAGHQGALIDQVTTGSPAEKAGLKSGQLIESVDGKPVNSQTALSDAISAHKPGDKVTLSIYDPQTSKTSDVQVTLGDNPQKTGTAWLGISYGYFNPQPRPNNNGNGTQL